MSIQLDYTRFPRVQIWRRGIAFGIDFFSVWLLSSLLGGNLAGFQLPQGIVFTLAWFGLRVLLVYRNQGQSLGRWALNTKVLDTKLGQVPGLQALCQREAVIGSCALLAAITLGYVTFNLGTILLIIPLCLDCGIAVSDITRRQAFHDQVARTMIVSSRRGYSLDLKVKRLLAKLRQNMK